MKLSARQLREAYFVQQFVYGDGGPGSFEVWCSDEVPLITVIYTVQPNGKKKAIYRVKGIGDFNGTHDAINAYNKSFG